MSEFALGDRIFASDAATRRHARTVRSTVEVDWSSTTAGRRDTSSFAGAQRATGDGKARTAARAATRSRAERFLSILVATIGAAVLAVAAFLVLPGALRITRYTVTGNATMATADVLGAALVRGNEHFFSVDTDAMRAALLAEPRVAAATVSRVFPNGLRIAVTERQPAAFVLVEEEGRAVPVCIDEAGVAYAWAKDALSGVSGASDLPVLSGIRFEGFRLGTRLPAEFVPTLAAIGEIERKAPALLAAFSEIKLVKPAHGEPELLLYSLHYRVPVRTGAVLNESTLRSIILVLDVMGSNGLADGVKEIDFRTGTVVYRVKEGQSG
jgi:cell division protein FtsQ